MVGQTVGHYRIVRKIGEGGMGHVYLADDLQLDRQVALKTLADARANSEQLARFHREAKAAAALNHPNILAIHDYGVEASTPYVVMELLEGRNLRQLLHDGPLTVQLALDYGGEIANGLSAAHDRGICHRDLKPENIFVTNDGRVKILDFGLATYDGAIALATSAQDQATHAPLTTPGLMMGTVGYMAPEQVRGDRVDVRADVFAFGAVLFEMLTGRRAFDEASAVETLHAILRVDPPLHLLNEVRVPAALVAIAQRCLHKNRDERFASTRDLAAAIRKARSAGQTPPDTATQSFSTPRPAPIDATLAVKIERITNASAVTLSPSLSPDGRMVAYLSDGGEDDTAPQVWLQQIGGAGMRLTTGLRDCADPAFTADQTHVLFTAREGTSLNIYQVPTLSGEPRLVKRQARCGRMSPDGRWVSYLSLDSSPGVRIMSAGGEGDRALAPHLIDASSAVWSPDSQYLLVRAHPDTAFEREYWIVPLDGGTPINTRIVERVRGQVLDLPPAWLGAGCVFVAGTPDGVMLLRQRFAPGSFELAGDPEPLTPATEWAAWPSTVGNRLAFVSAHPDHNLWSIALDPSTGLSAGPPRRLTRGPGLMGQLSWTRDGGTVVYFSTRTRKPELVLRNFQNGSERLVTNEPAGVVKGYPAISPSGSQLAHGMLVPGARARRPIVVVDLAEGTSRQLSQDAGGRPRLWIDERNLLIETFGARLNSLVVIDTITGARRELLRSTNRSISNPCLSPDATRIAFDATPAGGMPATMVAPLDRDVSVPESEWAVIEERTSHPFWSADGRLLYYLPVTPNNDLRSGARARRIAVDSIQPEGDAFDAISFGELFVPTMVPGTTPLIASGRVISVLADLRGDIWMMSPV